MKARVLNFVIILFLLLFPAFSLQAQTNPKPTAPAPKNKTIQELEKEIELLKARVQILEEEKKNSKNLTPREMASEIEFLKAQIKDFEEWKLHYEQRVETLEREKKEVNDDLKATKEKFQKILEESEKEKEENKKKLQAELDRIKGEWENLSQQWKDLKHLKAGLDKLREEEEAAAAEKARYWLPAQIWKDCSYLHGSEHILDMTTESWCKMSVEDQRKYARSYQEGYAKKKNLEINKKIIKSRVVFEFQLVPPGRYWMGSPDGESGRSPNEKRHRVIVSKAYYIGKYEITQAQWLAVMGSNPSNFSNVGSNAPVEQVSWNDCQDFCKKTGFFLPTEAQWEYACRAGTTTAFNFGIEIRQDKVNYNTGTTMAVGSLSNENAWGCYDFHGNVWEWCKDAYVEYSGDNIVDPEYQNGSSFVFRGGSWYGVASSCRSSNRYSYESGFRILYLGFRCFCIPTGLD